MKNGRIVTIKDIAKEVCMSVSTVSRALSGNTNIAEETRAKIEKVALELGYRPNQTALSLKSGRTHTIGVILPDMVDTFFYEIYSSINKTLWECGWAAFVVFSEEDVVKERGCLELMERQHVDGIIMCVCDAEYNSRKIQSMMDRGYKFVFFDRSPALPNITSIEIDNEYYMFFLVQHLIEQGYRRIAYLNSPDSLHYSQARLKGYRDAVAKHGLLDKGLIFRSGGMKFKDGLEMADRIMGRIDGIDAIVVCDDVVALGVMHEMQKAGIRVPEDVAITGFGGSMINTMVVPEITTVEFPKVEIGRQAATLILGKIDNTMKEDAVINMKARIVYRASSGGGIDTPYDTQHS